MINHSALVVLRWVYQTLLTLALSSFFSQSLATDLPSNIKESTTPVLHQFCKAIKNNNAVACISRSSESQIPNLLKRRKTYSGGTIHSIGSLNEGVIFQRNSDGVPVEVPIMIKMDDTQPLEYQVHYHKSNRKTSWQLMEATSSNIARTNIRLPAGLHSVVIRNANNKTILDRIENIGVGEVFVVIGQRKYAETKQLSNSPWLVLAKLLAECTKLPIHIIDAGSSDSLIKEWEPSTDDGQLKESSHLARLRNVVRLAREYNGVRSFFWLHGTPDALEGTSSPNYERSLNRLIQLSRRELNQDLPWFVALYSQSDSLTSQNHGQEIILAQLRVIQNDSNIFLGSEADKYFLHDKIFPEEPRLLSKDWSAYSEFGHQELGKEWFNRLKVSGLVSEMAQCAMKKVSYSVPKPSLTEDGLLDLLSVRKDTKPPIMTLEPAVRLVQHVISEAFSTPKISCNDNVDGRVEPTIEGYVNLQIAGIYRKHFQCRDSAGNSVTHTLTVVVRNAKDGHQFVVTTAKGQLVNTLATSHSLLDSDELPITVVSSLNFTDQKGDTGYFSGDRQFPNISDNKQNFAMKAILNFELASADNYILGTRSDDGVLLKIDGKTLIIDDNLHSEQDNIVNVYLSAGAHTLELLFFDAGGSASLELFGGLGAFHPGTSFEDYDLKLLVAPINGKLFEK